MNFFNLQHQDKNSHARAGVIHTDHGDIETPMFMPVGTQASVKTLDQKDLRDIGAQIILGNTYHLHLRPGENLIADHGGLHKFMNWDKPILTDSGGFQVFSLGLQKSLKHKNIKTLKQQSNTTIEQCNNETFDKNGQGRLVSIDEEGVTFKSYIDGSAHRFTPESAIEIQHKIGADIIMAFDECTPDNAPEEYVRKAMERTHRWAERSLNFHKNIKTSKHKNTYRQFLFGIIQGSNYKHLREESAKFISNLDFDGIAIGGESIGYNMEATADILDWVYPIIPEDKPHYAMGLGLNPMDLLIAVEHGADMFDCVGPTRLARHGVLFIKDKNNNNRLNIKNSKYKNDTLPIDEHCLCSTCKNYSRSYLHHLVEAREISAMRLATIHNLHFMINLMSEARKTILNNEFIQFKKQWEQ